MNKRVSFYLGIICIFISSFSVESVESVINAVEAKYTSLIYFSYESTYNVYDLSNKKDILESTKGVFLKKKSVNYQKLNNNEIIDFGDYNFFANHTDKTIIINRKDANTQFITLKSLLPLFKNKVIEKRGLEKVCVLTTSKISQSPYNKVEIYVNAKTNELIKQVFYFSYGKEYLIKGKKKKITQPVLEVTYKSNIKNDVKENILINQSNYFTINNKKIVLASKYKNYKLISE